MIYLKKKLVDSEDFNVIRVEDVEADGYLEKGYVEATEEEYTKQFADREAPISSEADAALGGETLEVENLELEDHVVTEEDLVMLKENGINDIEVGETIQVPVVPQEEGVEPPSEVVEESKFDETV
jgi:hypothetical protein